MRRDFFGARDVAHWHAAASAAGRHGVIRSDGDGGHVLWGRQHDLSGSDLYPVAPLDDAGLKEARRLRMSEWDV